MIYCINKGIINIYRYKLTVNDENNTVMYACNEEEIDAIKEYWESELHYTLSVEELDNSEYYWMEGIPANGPEEADRLLKAGESAYLDNKYSPSMLDSLTALASTLVPTLKDSETILKVSGLIAEYTPGKHTKEEVYRAIGQVWECIQDFDTAIYPDITPGSSEWFTFNKPYHGKSVKTARPWLKPEHGKSVKTARPWLKPEHGITDMYLKDEYMIYTDDQVYKCLRDTVYSPEEYSADWEKQ